LKRTVKLLPAVALAASILLPGSAGAQSVLERTPNLSGGWVGAGGTGHFNFLHRFHTAGEANKVVNWPGFLLGYSASDVLLAGAHYTSFSQLVEGEFNEWELFVRFAPLPPGAGLPLSVAVTGAYNEAAESVDGELAVGVPLGRLAVLGALRAFSNGFGTADARVAAGGGASFRLTERVALAGDVVTPLGTREGEGIAWGAALQLEIPSTPHSLSLQVANTNSSSLQGSSSRPVLGRTGPRWGFEFTVPLTLARYLGGGGDARDVTITADTVRVPIRDFEFGIQRLVVQPGTTVIWVNEGDVAHTSTSDAELWSSPFLATGESYSRVFDEPGEYPYHCAPHTFMTAVVVVQGVG
jgi:plastocyanin